MQASRSALVTFAFAVTTSVCLQGQIFSDNFNDNSKDPLFWTGGFVEGNGSLVEQSQRTEYLVPTPHQEFDQALQTWATSLPVDKNWTATLLTGITLSPTQSGQNVSIGLGFHHPTDFEKFLFVEHYTETGSGQPFRGFLSSMDSVENEGLTGNLGVMNGAVQLSYNAATKVITASFDRDGAAGGFSWEFLASFGLAGPNGATGGADWNLPASGGFRLSVEAFSERLTVPAGAVWVDDFKVTIADNAPELSISRVGDMVVISWSAAAEGFDLFTKGALSDASWMAAPQATRLDDVFQVTVPIGAGNQFFQLIK